MKKALTSIIVIVFVLLASLSIFAACDSTDYEKQIIFYSSQGANYEPITQHAIDAFENKFPGWTVKHQRVGGYDDVRDKVMNDLPADNQPDIAYCYPDHVAMYMETGKVLNLSKYINSTETILGKDGEEDYAYPIGMTLDDIDPSYLPEGLAKNYDGYDQNGFERDDYVTLPFVKSTELLFYNADAIESLNFTLPETWDELWDQCETVKYLYPTSTPLAYDSEANWFITMCEQNGWPYTSATGDHYLFNTPEAAAWLEELKGHYDDKLFTTQQDYGGQYTSNVFKKGLAEGGSLYCIGSSGGAGNQTTNLFKTGVTHIPGTEVGGVLNSKCISQGPSLVMFKSGHGIANADEKQKMTFMFLKELLDPVLQEEFSEASGYNTASLSARELPSYKTFLANESKITAKAVNAANAISEAKNFFTSPAFVGSSNARNQVESLMLNAFTGKMSPAEALARAVQNCGGNR